MCTSPVHPCLLLWASAGSPAPRNRNQRQILGVLSLTTAETPRFHGSQGGLQSGLKGGVGPSLQPTAEKLLQLKGRARTRNQPQERLLQPGAGHRLQQQGSGRGHVLSRHFIERSVAGQESGYSTATMLQVQPAGFAELPAQWFSWEPGSARLPRGDGDTWH